MAMKIGEAAAPWHKNGTDYFPINPSASYDGYRPPFAIGDAPREQIPSGVRFEPQAPYQRSDQKGHRGTMPGAIISEEGLVRPEVSPSSKRHYTVAERALNPELDKQLEAKRKHMRQVNHLAMNKGKVHAQSRANQGARRESQDAEAAGPVRVAEGTRTKYAHVHSVFLADAEVKGKPPPSRVLHKGHDQARKAWMPNARKSDVRPTTAASTTAPRLSQTVEVPRRDSEPAWATTSGKQSRTLALPKYLVDRKQALQATHPDEHLAALAVDPEPPDGYRWVSEQTRKAEIRKWKVKTNALQAELDACDTLTDVDGSTLWKRRKEIELKLQRANTKLRLLGDGRSRGEVLTNKSIVNDPECPLKVETSFVVAGKVDRGAVRRTKLVIAIDAKKKIWVEVNLEKCTVRQLKEKIEDKTGVPPRWQNLKDKLGNTLSDDTRQLTSYSVTGDTLLRLTVRARAEPMAPEGFRTQPAPPPSARPPWALDL